MIVYQLFLLRSSTRSRPKRTRPGMCTHTAEIPWPAGRGAGWGWGGGGEAAQKEPRKASSSEAELQRHRLDGQARGWMWKVTKDCYRLLGATKLLCPSQWVPKFLLTVELTFQEQSEQKNSTEGKGRGAGAESPVLSASPSS